MEDETLFRNVHYQEMREPITSIRSIYSEDSEEPSALRYTACFRLCRQYSKYPPDIHKTLDMLEKAVSLGTSTDFCLESELIVLRKR